MPCLASLRAARLPPARLLGLGVVALRCSMLAHLRCSGSALARRVAQCVPAPLFAELYCRPRFAWAERATARATLGRKEMLAFALLRLAGPIARATLGLPPPQGPTSPTGRSCKKTLAAGAAPRRTRRTSPTCPTKTLATGRPEKELAILRKRCYIWTSGPVSFS